MISAIILGLVINIICWFLYYKVFVRIWPRAHTAWEKKLWFTEQLIFAGLLIVPCYVAVDLYAEDGKLSSMSYKAIGIFAAVVVYHVLKATYYEIVLRRKEAKGEDIYVNEEGEFDEVGATYRAMYEAGKEARENKRKKPFKWRLP